MERPGQMRLGRIAADAAPGGAEAGIDKVIERIERNADAGADEGRQTVPGAEVDITVGENDHRPERAGIDVA